MGGVNPYIKGGSAELPKQKFSIEFRAGVQPSGTKVEVDPSQLPASGIGRPGSILDVAMAEGIDIDHACGGVAACSTCHVIVRQGLRTCNDTSEEEEDQLDKAPGVTPQSRLACQCVADGSEDLIVEIPSWNRNLVREGNPSK